MPLIPVVGRDTFKVRMVLITIALFLWIGVFLHLFLLWWTVSGAFKTNDEIMGFPPTFWPHKFTLRSLSLVVAGNKINILGGGMAQSILLYAKNTLIVVIGTVLLQIPITALAAYALSKLHGPWWGRVLFLIFISSMLVPGQVSLVPRYFLMQNFPWALKVIPKIPFTNVSLPHVNLLNTLWAVILPSSFSAFNLLLFKGHFDTIPNSILDAARVDGASELSIMRRLVVPMSGPIMSVVVYFLFGAAWNDFMWPFIVLKNPSQHTMSIGLFLLQQNIRMMSRVGGGGGGEEMTWNIVMAFGLIQTIPVFVMFLIFREQLMKGIKLRGFK